MNDELSNMVTKHFIPSIVNPLLKFYLQILNAAISDDLIQFTLTTKVNEFGFRL